MTLKFNNILGMIAIVTGAVATFDNGMMPVIRYLTIYFSLLVIMGVVLYNIYVNIEETPTLDKVKDEQ